MQQESDCSTYFPADDGTIDRLQMTSSSVEFMQGYRQCLIDTMRYVASGNDDDVSQSIDGSIPFDPVIAQLSSGRRQYHNRTSTPVCRTAARRCRQGNDYADVITSTRRRRRRHARSSTKMLASLTSSLSFTSHVTSNEISSHDEISCCATTYSSRCRAVSMRELTDSAAAATISAADSGLMTPSSFSTTSGCRRTDSGSGNATTASGPSSRRDAARHLDYYCCYSDDNDSGICGKLQRQQAATTTMPMEHTTSGPSWTPCCSAAVTSSSSASADGCLLMVDATDRAAVASDDDDEDVSMGEIEEGAAYLARLAGDNERVAELLVELFELMDDETTSSSSSSADEESDADD